ncbi:MAG: type VI secretion system tube protein TssD [Planctomycetota bacterium]
MPRFVAIALGVIAPLAVSTTAIAQIDPPTGPVGDSGPSLAQLAGAPPTADTAQAYISVRLEANGTLITRGSETPDPTDPEFLVLTGFQFEVNVDRDAGSGLATGRRTYEPIVFRKRIDKASPLIAKSLTNNESVTGAFKFFRPSPAGDGATEHYYTIEFADAQVVSLRHLTVPLAAGEYTHEEAVGVIFRNVTYRHEPSGIEHTDTVGTGV